jgi:hypothetical protein
MLMDRLVPLLFIAACCSCACDQDSNVVSGVRLQEDPVIVYKNSAGVEMNALTFDIVQRTCAMYFAVRSRAIDESIGFGRDLDEVDVHWNKCPGGNMVACAKVPSANGDSTQMGIPWPY